MGRNRIGGWRTERREAAIVVLSVWMVLGLAAGAWAGTTGKVTGFVVDYRERPVAGATVSVLGTALWGLTDVTGRYNIIGVAPGTWRIEATKIGLQTVITTNVLVSSDQSTWVDFELPSPEDVMRVVEVVADRPVIDVRLSSSKSILTRDEIENLPVQELNDVVNLQAGVVNGHFRGGRIGEVQYQVDGVSVNNAYDNRSGLRLDRSLLEEVQVISGTFDVEYGQAMSGVVNAVLRSGTRTFRWDAEGFSGGYLFPGGEERRITGDEFHPAAVQNYQFTLSGPTGLPGTVYLLNGRRYLFDDYITAEDIFSPTDSHDVENALFFPTGSGNEVPLGYSNEWSGALKISNSSIPTLRLNYQAVLNDVEARRSDFAFRFLPEGRPKQETRSISHGVDVTHTLSPTTFYNLNLRQNYFDYSDYVYEDVYDPRYDAAGGLDDDHNYEEGAWIQGVDFTRFEQRTDAYIFKGSVLNQVNREHLLKVGGEFQWAHIRFGTPGHLVYTTSPETGTVTLLRFVDQPPDFPGVERYEPRIGAAFAQDEVEWNDMMLRAGLRYDYFDARSTVPSDLSNPANSIEGAPESVPVETSVKSYVSPRIGVVYPVTDRAAVHFSYGHFIQFPPLGDIFRNADYSVLSDLQAGGIDYGVRGNPDIEPEKTVQYEFGYKQALTEHIGADLTLFYKDIRDLLGVEFVSTYNAAEYARLTNIDYGSVVGFTLAFDQRRIGLLSTSVDYTWQLARGNSSDPRETATRASNNDDPRPRQIPFDWDQRHTLNMTISLAKPGEFSVSTVIRAVSGQPYTPQIETGFGYGLEDNSGRKPSSVLVDLRAERKLGGGYGLHPRLFARVFNALDNRYFNGFVFPTTGSPYYSRVPQAVDDPTRYYPARRVELGIKLGSGG